MFIPEFVDEQSPKGIESDVEAIGMLLYDMIINKGSNNNGIDQYDTSEANNTKNRQIEIVDDKNINEKASEDIPTNFDRIVDENVKNFIMKCMEK